MDIKKVKIARIYQMTDEFLQKHDTEDRLWKKYKTEDLTIDGNNISFLRNLLLENSGKKNFKRIINSEREQWILSFFPDSELFKQYFIIDFYDAIESDKSKDWKEYSDKMKSEFRHQDFDDIAKLVFLPFDGEQPNQKEIEHACLAIRNTKSINSIDDLVESTIHFSHVDGNGLMYLNINDNLDCNKGLSHFYRTVILLTLGHAYLGAMEVINTKLSEIINLKKNAQNCESELREIYLQTAKFNARYMFSLPVLKKNEGLVATWFRISQALQIEKLNNELNNQLGIVHHILKIDDDVQNEKFQNRITKIAFFISILSILSIANDIKGLFFS